MDWRFDWELAGKSVTPPASGNCCICHDSFFTRRQALLQTHAIDTANYEAEQSVTSQIDQSYNYSSNGLAPKYII